MAASYTPTPKLPKFEFNFFNGPVTYKKLISADQIDQVCERVLAQMSLSTKISQFRLSSI